MTPLTYIDLHGSCRWPSANATYAPLHERLKIGFVLRYLLAAGASPVPVVRTLTCADGLVGIATSLGFKIGKRRDDLEKVRRQASTCAIGVVQKDIIQADVEFIEGNRVGLGVPRCELRAHYVILAL